MAQCKALILPYQKPVVEEPEYISTPSASMPHNLEEIPGLKCYTIAYYQAGKVAICLCCKTAVRPECIHGHIISEYHWRMLRIKKKPTRAAVDRDLESYEFIPSNQSVTLPPGPLAPFPFLKLLPDGTSSTSEAEIG